MSGTTSKPSKAEALARLLALISGTEKHLPNGNFTIGNASYTTPSLVQLLQSLADAMTAVNNAQAAVKDALAALKATKAKVVPVMLVYRQIVVRMYAGATSILADFGLQPPKAPAPKTTEEKAAAAAKAAATRKARGTTSKKQKLAVKGDVTGVTITPVTSPAVAANSPSAQTAPNASNAPTTPATGTGASK